MSYISDEPEYHKRFMLNSFGHAECLILVNYNEKRQERLLKMCVHHWGGVCQCVCIFLCKIQEEFKVNLDKDTLISFCAFIRVGK